MGLTCSLLGHAYGNSETEREREERGDEVVVTTRELRKCTRCGETSIVSENTEVRTRGHGTSSTNERAEDEPELQSEYEPPAEAGDEGIILENTADDASERSTGEWPSAPDTRLSASEAEMESRTTTPDSEGGARTDDQSAEGGHTPQDTGSEDRDGSPEPSPTSDQSLDVSTTDADSPTTREDDGIADVTGRAWPDEGPGGTRRDDAESSGQIAGAAGIVAAEDQESAQDGEIILSCPSCTFGERATGSSHREGDICPECRRGYLAERTRN